MSDLPNAQGKYKTATKFGNIIITAGMTPRDSGELIKTGKIKKHDDVKTYREALRLAVRNALKAAETQLDQNEKIGKVIAFSCYINAEEGYKDHAKIANLASEYLEEQLGSKGIGSRAAIGVQSLPGNAIAEIQIIVGIDTN